MRIVNLTPHQVVISMPNGTVVQYPPAGVVARVEVKQEKIEFINAAGEPSHPFPIVSNTFSEEIVNLPPPEEGTWFIVSGLVRTALGDTREDVLAPDTGATAIRENGQVVAVTRMVGVQKGQVYRVSLKGHVDLISVYVPNGQLWIVEKFEQVCWVMRSVAAKAEYDFHLTHDYAALKAYLEDTCSTCA